MKKMIVLLFITMTGTMQCYFEKYRVQNAYKQGDMQQAQYLLDEMLTQEPDNAEVAYNLGKVALKQKEFVKAVAYFNLVTQTKTASASLREQAWYDRGLSQVHMQQWEDALASYEEVLKINADNEYAQKMIDQIKKILEEKKQQEDQQKKESDENKKDQKSDNDDHSDKKDTDKNKQDKQQDNQNDDEQSQEQKQDSSSEQEKKRMSAISKIKILSSVMSKIKKRNLMQVMMLKTKKIILKIKKMLLMIDHQRNRKINNRLKKNKTSKLHVKIKHLKTTRKKHCKRQKMMVQMINRFHKNLLIKKQCYYN